MMDGGPPVKRGYLRQAWLVLILAFAYGGALAGVQSQLAPRIADNKLQETLDVIPLLVDGADPQRTELREITGTDGNVTRVYRTFDGSGHPNGWVLPAAGQGFADKIELLVGLDAPLATITGMYVLDQKETPGLGDYIRDRNFQERFRNRPSNVPLAAVKSDPVADHEILALTGATVSSWSVCEIVNQAITRLREPILQETDPQEANKRGS